MPLYGPYNDPESLGRDLQYLTPEEVALWPQYAGNMLAVGVEPWANYVFSIASKRREEQQRAHEEQIRAHQRAQERAQAEEQERFFSPIREQIGQQQMQNMHRMHHAQKQLEQQYAQHGQKLSPVLLHELGQQMEQGTQFVPVRPRKSISQRVLENFDPRMFSPEFIPEEE